MTKAPPPRTPKPVEPVALAEPQEDSPPEAPPTQFSLLSPEQLRAFAQTDSPHERLAILSTVLRVAHYDANPRSLVWVDFCFHTLSFALEDAQLSEAKTLALLHVANEVFRFATSPTLQDEPNSPCEASSPSAEATYERFRQLVRTNSVAVASPGEESPQLWDTSDVARIVSFMSSTFFRHLSAYQHVFRFPRESLEREIAVVVETPLAPPPLALATQECTT